MGMDAQIRFLEFRSTFRLFYLCFWRGYFYILRLSFTIQAVEGLKSFLFSSAVPALRNVFRFCVCHFRNTFVMLSKEVLPVSLGCGVWLWFDGPVREVFGILFVWSRSNLLMLSVGC